MQTKKIKTKAAARAKDTWASDMLPPCLCVLCEHSPEEDGRRVCANGDPLRLCTQISLPLVVWHIPLVPRPRPRDVGDEDEDEDEDEKKGDPCDFHHRLVVHCKEVAQLRPQLCRREQRLVAALRAHLQAFPRTVADIVNVSRLNERLADIDKGYDWILKKYYATVGGAGEGEEQAAQQPTAFGQALASCIGDACPCPDVGAVGAEECRQLTEAGAAARAWLAKPNDAELCRGMLRKCRRVLLLRRQVGPEGVAAIASRTTREITSLQDGADGADDGAGYVSSSGTLVEAETAEKAAAAAEHSDAVDEVAVTAMLRSSDAPESEAYYDSEAWAAAYFRSMVVSATFVSVSTARSRSQTAAGAACAARDLRGAQLAREAAEALLVCAVVLGVPWAPRVLLSLEQSCGRIIPADALVCLAITQQLFVNAEAPRPGVPGTDGLHVPDLFREVPEATAVAMLLDQDAWH